MILFILFSQLVYVYSSVVLQCFVLFIVFVLEVFDIPEIFLAPIVLVLKALLLKLRVHPVLVLLLLEMCLFVSLLHLQYIQHLLFLGVLLKPLLVFLLSSPILDGLVFSFELFLLLFSDLPCIRSDTLALCKALNGSRFHTFSEL